MIGGHSRTAWRIAGGGTGAPENGRNDAANGWASPLGRSSRPARSIQHEPRPKIALQTPFAALILVEGKPNGECRISFLGLGIQPPLTSLGNMVGFGRDYLLTAWWIAVFPALAIFIATLAMSILDDWVRDRLDPTLKT